METMEVKKIKIAGKQMYSITDVKIFDVLDTEGHKVSLRKGEGTNTSSGDSAFLNGMKLTNLSYADLVNNNGPHQGYTNVEKDGNTGAVKWQGNIETKMLDGKPVPTFQGTFTWIKATGSFQKIEGCKGIFKGHFTSETTYEVDWEGEI